MPEPMQVVLNPGRTLDMLRLYLHSFPVSTLALASLGSISLLAFAANIKSFVDTHFIHTSALPRYLHRRAEARTSTDIDTTGSSSSDDKSATTATAPSPGETQETQAWALVTGASDGIGKAFAHELAAAGFNLLLHGRNPAKLAAVIESICTEFPSAPIQIDTVILDATTFTHDDIDALAQRLRTLPGPLTILINNVGGMPAGQSPYRSLERYDAALIERVLDMNIRLSVQITRAALPLLQENVPAAILNMGSLAGPAGLPLLSVYAGTKSFILSWSKSLARERRWVVSSASSPFVAAHGTGVEAIEVKGFLVGSVSETSGFREKSETLDRPSARTLARGALNKLGLKGVDVVPATFGHALNMEIMKWLPDSFVEGKFEGAVQNTDDWKKKVV